MKIAFLTEMNFRGVIVDNHINMRTEFAWMNALNANHYNIMDYNNVKNYDAVLVILPKGRTFLDASGSKIADGHNTISSLLATSFASLLKQYNKKVFYVQEGPHWLWNDYELSDQILFYNFLVSCDGIFAHNSTDLQYYRGLIKSKPVFVIPTLMIDHLIKDIVSSKQDKAIIGGNFARWYGGFESFIVAQESQLPIWAQTSHASRAGEEQLINQLPRLMWIDWMKQLSEYKYAVHLMPTVAAGTFSLNCAYFGIPCIGNRDVDTQKHCFPDLSVNVNDIEKACSLMQELVNNNDFYNKCSSYAKTAVAEYCNVDKFRKYIIECINETK